MAMWYGVCEMSMRTKIKVICLCFIVGAGQAFWLETLSNKSVQPNCDKEVADQLWEAVYGGMSDTDKMAGVVLEPIGAEK